MTVRKPLPFVIRSVPRPENDHRGVRRCCKMSSSALGSDKQISALENCRQVQRIWRIKNKHVSGIDAVHDFIGALPVLGQAGKPDDPAGSFKNKSAQRRIVR